MEADLIIKNGMVMTLDDKFTLYDQADVAVKGTKIVDLAPQTKYTAKRTLDAAGKLVMPGLINAHTHSAMVMMRGLADDMPLDIWWKKFIFPIEHKLLTPEFIEIGTALAAIEMIKSGTTCFSDMYYFQAAAAPVYKRIGIRAVLGEAIMDHPTPDAPDADATNRLTEQLLAQWGQDDLISLSVAPHAPYSCGADNLLKAKKLADKYNLPLHIHVAETAGEVAEFQQKHGQTPVEYLAKLGFLGEKVMAIHCVHVTPDDVKLLRRHDVKIVHCQESNMKLASGYSPIVEMQFAGLTIALGTDGAASNNNLDMFDEMDSVAKFHKLIRNDPTVMEAKTVIRMATSDAAQVIGQKKELGSLESGRTADLILIDLRSPQLTPMYNPYSHLVYSAGGSEVDSAVINGKLVMENRKILTIDEDEVLDRANRLAQKIKTEVAHG
jgi:5-methylthioadenosine/S-adenosylhomocysteine deaminase